MTMLAGARPEESVNVFALQWYLQMQAGQIDRTQLTDAYSAQLTDHAVRRCPAASTSTGRRRGAPKFCEAAR
jgi:hypothetical protein